MGQKEIKRNRTTLDPLSEQKFLIEFQGDAKKRGMNTDPDDPGQKYDLRGAWQAGYGPSSDTHHWPSQFKDDDHPRRFLKYGADNSLKDTRTGQPATKKDLDEQDAVTRFLSSQERENRD